MSAKARIFASGATLGFNRGVDRRVGAERMRPARLAEAAHQHCVRGFEKSHLGGNDSPDRFQNSGKLVEL